MCITGQLVILGHRLTPYLFRCTYALQPFTYSKNIVDRVWPSSAIDDPWFLHLGVLTERFVGKPKALGYREGAGYAKRVEYQVALINMR